MYESGSRTLDNHGYKFAIDNSNSPDNSNNPDNTKNLTIWSALVMSAINGHWRDIRFIRVIRIIRIVGC